MLEERFALSHSEYMRLCLVLVSPFVSSRVWLCVCRRSVACVAVRVRVRVRVCTCVREPLSAHTHPHALMSHTRTRTHTRTHTYIYPYVQHDMEAVAETVQAVRTSAKGQSDLVSLAARLEGLDVCALTCALSHSMPPIPPLFPSPLLLSLSSSLPLFPSPFPCFPTVSPLPLSAPPPPPSLSLSPLPA